MNSKRLLHLITFIFIVTLYGCGDSAYESKTISGVVSAGRLKGATVSVFRIVDGTKGAMLNSTTTDNHGEYTVDIVNYSGPVLIEVAGNGAKYIDEATAAEASLNMPLRAMKENVGKAENIMITPLTEMAYVFATALGGLDPDRIQLTNKVIANDFGIEDIVATKPSDVLSEESSSEPLRCRKYGLTLAALSTMGPLDSVMDAFGRDMKKGGLLLEANSNSLAQAMDSFISGPHNKTEITTATELIGLMAGGSQTPRILQLPNNWVVEYTSDGFPVYVHLVTGERYDFRHQMV